MEITKDKLKNALSTLKPGLSKKDGIGESNCFVFNNGYISTFNNELWFNYPMPEIQESFIIGSDEIMQLLDKTKVDTVTLNVTEKLLVLQAGKSKAGFNTIAIEVPVDVSFFENKVWEKLPTDFQTAIKFAAMSASNDLINPIVQCVSVKSDGTIVGTNNFRLSFWDLGTTIPIKDTLIPADSILKILTINPTSFISDDEWIHFKNDEGVIASCRVLYDNFPNVTPVLNKIKGGHSILFPDGINNALDKAIIFIEDDKQAQTVSISYKSNYLSIDSESDSKGFYKERILMDADVSDFNFLIDPSFLKDILKRSKKCLLHTEQNIISFQDENWTYLAMLKQ